MDALAAWIATPLASPPATQVEWNERVVPLLLGYLSGLNAERLWVEQEFVAAPGAATAVDPTRQASRSKMLLVTILDRPHVAVVPLLAGVPIVEALLLRGDGAKEARLRRQSDGRWTVCPGASTSGPLLSQESFRAALYELTS